MAQSIVTAPFSAATKPTRGVARTARGMETSDGAGVKLTRVIGTPKLRGLDPFLMLDEFRSDDPKEYAAGFPDHPHRGFETFTYMLAGRFRHHDNKGNEGLLGPGGGQWMTAGRGIVHSEMPEQEQGLAWGFQLWINLPAKDKRQPAGYLDVQPGDIPSVDLGGGVTARVVAGTVAGVKGPIDSKETEVVYLEVVLPKGAEARIPVPVTHDGFLYPFEGGVSVGDEGAEKALVRGELGVLEAVDSKAEVRLVAKDGPARVLVVAGKPIREPVVQYGPFVMNTMSEIEEAIRDFNRGAF